MPSQAHFGPKFGLFWCRVGPVSGLIVIVIVVIVNILVVIIIIVVNILFFSFH